MSDIYIPVPYRGKVFSLTEFHKRRKEIDSKIESKSYSKPFILHKAEYLFDIVFSEDMEDNDIKVVFLYTLNGYCWWFDKGEDITFEDSFQRLIMDLSFYTQHDDIISLLNAMKEEYNLNNLDIDKEEWIRIHLLDVKWCLADMFGMVIRNGVSHYINEYDWCNFLSNN